MNGGSWNFQDYYHVIRSLLCSWRETDNGCRISELAWPQDRQAARDTGIMVVNLTKGAGDVLR
jgi:hypothetical protein